MDNQRSEFSTRIDFLREKLLIIWEQYMRLEELRSQMQVIPFDLDWDEFLCNLPPAINNLIQKLRETVEELRAMQPGDVSHDSAIEED